MRIIKAVRFLALLLGVYACLIAPGAHAEAERLTGFLTDGKPFDLAQHRGKLVVMPFWATWCPACRAEFPTWQKVYERYQGKKFEMVAVSIDRSARDLEKFQKAKGYTVPVVWRFDERADDSFPAIRKTPTMVFIGADGNVALVHVGRMSEDQLIDNIEVLMPD